MQISKLRRPAAEYKLPELRELFRRADRQYRLQLKRGTELLNVELRTRRLV